MRTLVAYVPVLHEGYRRFFEMHKGPKRLYIFGLDLTAEYKWLSKEIRLLDPELMAKSVDALSIFTTVEVLDVQKAKELNSADTEIILPDEDVSRDLAARYFPNAQVSFEPVFLRWDKHNSIAEKPVVPDEQITRDEFSRKVVHDLEKEAEKSSDIWRHIAAAIVKDGKVILTRHNEHLPSQHTPYANGDPRNNFHKGDHIEISTAVHAEAGLVADAARKGIALEGAEMYVTVFPCPPCAKVVALSGVKTLYCVGGYAVLDGEEVLKNNGVKIVYVE